MKISKLKNALKSLGSEALLADELNKAVRVLGDRLGNARKGFALQMLQPPAQYQDVVLQRLNNVFACDFTRAARVQAAWKDLPTSTSFLTASF